MGKVKFKINETLLTSIIFFIVLMAIIVWYKPTPDSFNCPNEYQTAEEYVNGVARWTSEEYVKKPGITKEELLNKREKLFYKYKCEKSRWTVDIFEQT